MSTVIPRQSLRACGVSGCSRPARPRGTDCWSCYDRYRRVRDRGPVVTIDSLLAVCWCGNATDFVARRDVLNGVTFSCGAPRCHPPETAA